MRTRLEMPATAFAFASASLAFCACGVTDIATEHSHDCEAGYNSVWTSQVDLDLDHSDTRTCPLDHDPDDLVETSAVVYDNQTELGGDPHAWSGELTAYDSYHFTNWVGYGLLGDPDLEYFGWGPNRGSGPDEWQACMNIDYYAAGSPDVLEVQVELWDTIAEPKAWIEVEHGDGDEG